MQTNKMWGREYMYSYMPTNGILRWTKVAEKYKMQYKNEKSDPRS